MKLDENTNYNISSMAGYKKAYKESSSVKRGPRAKQYSATNTADEILQAKRQWLIDIDQEVEMSEEQSEDQSSEEEGEQEDKEDKGDQNQEVQVPEQFDDKGYQANENTNNTKQSKEANSNHEEEQDKLKVEDEEAALPQQIPLRAAWTPQPIAVDHQLLTQEVAIMRARVDAAFATTAHSIAAYRNYAPTLDYTDKGVPVGSIWHTSPNAKPILMGPGGQFILSSTFGSRPIHGIVRHGSSWSREFEEWRTRVVMHKYKTNM